MSENKWWTVEEIIPTACDSLVFAWRRCGVAVDSPVSDMIYVNSDGPLILYREGEIGDAMDL